MTDGPWLGDACSLVDAFRRGERSPLEETEACLAAIEASGLNCLSHLDPAAALDAARDADVNRPFGGVPLGIKELEQVAGWPYTEASLVFADRVGTTDTIQVRRLKAAGAVPVGLCTASEFGGLNVGVTRLNGVTRNPWNPERTPGGSSGGSAAAVAGGLVPIATGGDGGGSIRIPAGFCGLVGLKTTYGRIPRGPGDPVTPMTVTKGPLARSVRDVARWLDVCEGYHPVDRFSLPAVGGWEARLGSCELAGLRVAVVPDGGSAVVRDEVAALVEEAATQLIDAAGMVRVDLDLRLPQMGPEWALSNLVTLAMDLGDRWPACKEQLTPAIAFGMEFAMSTFNLEMAAKVEADRVAAIEQLAGVFEQVDLIMCATNPDVAFPAHVEANTRVGDRKVGLENNGALTIPFNFVGNPSVSVPVGTVDGLPVGMQIAAAHHRDALVLDVALAAERERPWPLVAPGAPC